GRWLRPKLYPSCPVPGGAGAFSRAGRRLLLARDGQWPRAARDALANCDAWRDCTHLEGAATCTGVGGPRPSGHEDPEAIMHSSRMVVKQAGGFSSLVMDSTIFHHVLIADDSQPTRDVLCKTLERVGTLRVSQVENGAEAISFIERSRPDLLLC